MRRTMKAFCISVLAAGAVPAQAIAQNAPIEFRVVATARNPSACQQFDAALSRVHSFTATGDTASIRSAGGVTSNMKQTTPGVYTTNFRLGGTTLRSETAAVPVAAEGPIMPQPD